MAFSEPAPPCPDAPAVLLSAPMDTPAFVYDEQRVVAAAQRVASLAAQAGAKALYTLKPQSISPALRLIAPHVDGLSVSSLFEAKLSRDVLGACGTVHMTTPGLRADEIGAVAEVCDYLAFNSLSQWRALGPAVAGRCRCGLRLNPQLSFVADERYDPCRPHSKLGVPMAELLAAVRADASLARRLSGLHFHSNCDSATFVPLLETACRVESALTAVLDSLDWINLGGGYLYDEGGNGDALSQAAEMLGRRHGLEVFVEPGAAIVRGAGYLVATVIDLLARGGKEVAVLDTTVNHMPEVFEYQWSPPLAGCAADGPCRYILAGCTCLAGDLFGEYAFAEPLRVGSRVVFPDAGAYTTVKWHWFNGVRLPTVYALTGAGQLAEKKRFTYEDFLFRCGETADATLRARD